MVVSRLLRVDKKVTSISSSTYVAPLPYYYSFYDYLGAVYPVVHDPGYTRVDTTVSVETNVYATSKPDGELRQSLPRASRREMGSFGVSLSSLATSAHA